MPGTRRLSIRVTCCHSSRGDFPCLCSWTPAGAKLSALPFPRTRRLCRQAAPAPRPPGRPALGLPAPRLLASSQAGSALWHLPLSFLPGPPEAAPPPAPLVPFPLALFPALPSLGPPFPPLRPLGEAGVFPRRLGPSWGRGKVACGSDGAWPGGVRTCAHSQEPRHPWPIQTPPVLSSPRRSGQPPYGCRKRPASTAQGAWLAAMGTRPVGHQAPPLRPEVPGPRTCGGEGGVSPGPRARKQPRLGRLPPGSQGVFLSGCLGRGPLKRTAFRGHLPWAGARLWREGSPATHSPALLPRVRPARWPSAQRRGWAWPKFPPGPRGVPGDG